MSPLVQKKQLTSCCCSLQPTESVAVTEVRSFLAHICLSAVVVKVKHFSKVLAPIWAQSVAAGAADVGVGNTIGAFVKNGRHWLQGWRFLWRNRGPSTAAAARTSFGAGGVGVGSSGPNLLVQRLASRLLSWVSDGPAAKLRRDAAARLLFGGGTSRASTKVPILAFVGVTLAATSTDSVDDDRDAQSGILTKRDKLETVCEDIRVCIGATFGRNVDDEGPAVATFDRYEISLKDLQLGGVIAKGCNAIVHSAKWNNFSRVRSDSEGSSDSGTEVFAFEDESQDAFNMIEYPMSVSTKEVLPTISDLCKPFDGYDLAVKMMFNYEAESNAPAILNAMYKEIVPARNARTDRKTELFSNERLDRKKRLPPHPNIVDMKWLFADSVPHLPQAMSLYPDALPKRLNRNGAGRNMTLFLVMKRYHCSLQEYLRAYDPSPRTCLLLLTQLLEGVVHLGRHRVAHRDLKTDNILLDLNEGPDYPRLVITDFGCCLADNELGLKLPYYTEETDRGGNSALMAPEVSCARPGPYVTIDYDKADLWAVGALAYEIFGQKNPFYRTTEGSPRLDSRTYSDRDLPDLPPKAHPVAKQLIKAVLQRNPRNRPDSITVANVFGVLLFGPKKLVALESSVLRDVDIVQWLVTLAARVVIQQSVSEERRKMKRVEHQLLTTFLRRVKLEELSKSIGVFDLN